MPIVAARKERKQGEGKCKNCKVGKWGKRTNRRMVKMGKWALGDWDQRQ